MVIGYLAFGITSFLKELVSLWSSSMMAGVSED